MTSLPPPGFPAIEGDIALEQRAGALRDEVFGRQVFVRGVIEVVQFLPAKLQLLRHAPRQPRPEAVPARSRPAARGRPPRSAGGHHRSQPPDGRGHGGHPRGHPAAGEDAARGDEARHQRLPGHARRETLRRPARGGRELLHHQAGDGQPRSITARCRRRARSRSGWRRSGIWPPAAGRFPAASSSGLPGPDARAYRGDARPAGQSAAGRREREPVHFRRADALRRRGHGRFRRRRSNASRGCGCAIRTTSSRPSAR